MIIEFLDSSLPERVRVTDLASRVGLGASRLEHLFKEHVKTTIRDFIRERRLKHAATLLAAGDERISEISQRVGFADVSNFNHAFKKHYGLPPRAYRERLHGENEEVSDFHQKKAEGTND